MIYAIITTTAIYFLTWHLIYIPFMVGWLGFAFIHAVYIFGVYFAVHHLYSSLIIVRQDEPSDVNTIGFKSDD